MILDKNGQSAIGGALHGNISLGDSETVEGGSRLLYLLTFLSTFGCAPLSLFGGDVA